MGLQYGSRTTKPFKEQFKNHYFTVCASLMFTKVFWEGLYLWHNMLCLPFHTVVVVVFDNEPLLLTGQVLPLLSGCLNCNCFNVLYGDLECLERRLINTMFIIFINLSIELPQLKTSCWEEIKILNIMLLSENKTYNLIIMEIEIKTKDVQSL